MGSAGARAGGVIHAGKRMAHHDDHARQYAFSLPRVAVTDRTGRERECTWTGFFVRPLCVALYLAGRCTIQHPPIAIARETPDGRTVVFFGGL